MSTPSYPQPAGPPAPDHPQATTALVLGILGLVLCGVIAPFAWAIGGKAVRDIDASQGSIGGRGAANAGRILGIVGTVLLAIVALVVSVLLVATVFVGSQLETGFDEGPVEPVPSLAG